MFEKSWQIKTHGAGIRVCPGCSEAEWRKIVGENDGIGTFQTPSQFSINVVSFSRNVVLSGP
jgi:hypothetical protein